MLGTPKLVLGKPYHSTPNRLKRAPNTFSQKSFGEKKEVRVGRELSGAPERHPERG